MQKEAPRSRKINWLLEHDVIGPAPVYITTEFINSYWGKDRAAECSATMHDGKMYTYVRLAAKAYDSEMQRLAEHIEFDADMKADKVRFTSFEGRSSTHAMAAENAGIKLLVKHFKEGNSAFRGSPTGKFFKMVDVAVSSKGGAIDKRDGESMTATNKRLKLENTALKLENEALKALRGK